MLFQSLAESQEVPMSAPKNVWFVNFIGIGNGIIIIPILRCFEQTFPEARYFHSENPVLSDAWFISKAGLKNLIGFSPIAWRRFNKDDWPAIGAFIKKNEIETIVNLRNEGPKYDVGYYQFKEWSLHNLKSLSFWDLNFGKIENREKQKNLTQDVIDLLESKGVSFSNYNPVWLKTSDKPSGGIGFGMAASQKNKRWPIKKWIELGLQTKKQLKERIVLLPGKSVDEMREAEEVKNAMGEESCELIVHEALSIVAQHIVRLKCFVSNDTGLLHIASATGVPSIGLYISTDANVWAPNEKQALRSFENFFFKDKCPERKVHCGNCFHYYDSCPAIAEYGDDIDSLEVFNTMKELL